MSEEREPSAWSAAEAALATLTQIVEDHAHRAELLRRWDLLDRDERRRLLTLTRAMAGGEQA
ncbi:hypothetical protein [Roseomonas populi]|uniref:MarR family transcriptional regulator n=1 Tax=Roseomonas populi TaxID=3121582 RepID=A0ABT1X102_9PROT|nr:hypothetical protein [Roseomonas pecuniae]MCR0981466.1 hypothetical protein [Roseomonas pecuniae]